jgi:hypothetical protein
MCVWLIRVYAFVSGVCELGIDELRVSRSFNKDEEAMNLCNLVSFDF